jgi:hypothetical protein
MSLFTASRSGLIPSVLLVCITVKSRCRSLIEPSVTAFDGNVIQERLSKYKSGVPGVKLNRYAMAAFLRNYIS